ncbi:hypothetical protein PHLGIDRAFT_428889 [Phlebiopsis gigantea 11061_1 CR5-6]|uniref:Heterokaryon incompatibility domain-containing protein n=1 Tax=Phlebiopsis gigantea (strain 11061_1 CR5-6) TaxID=745531 RepID=A0A0C3RYG5_PHLG1|nr:hypothetical protein PHLGIDRAFT_428889 [Phlebiopsis gigantea 11061_1 CR5-6]
MDTGLLSFTTTLRSYFDHKNGGANAPPTGSDRNLPSSDESTESGDLSTPSNSWQASVYPSSESVLESVDGHDRSLPRVSFDAFLESGHALTEFEWDLEQAQTFSLLDIRDWWTKSSSISSEELGALVIKRRTTLWRLVLAQKHLGLSEAAFTVPVAPDTRPECYVLRPSDHGTHWRVPLQLVHLSPHAIPQELAAVQLYDAASVLARLNDIFGTNAEMEDSLELWLQSRIHAKMDLGLLYAYLRPWWRPWLASGEPFVGVLTRMSRRREEDSKLRAEAAEADPMSAGGRSAGASPRVINTRVPPRRVWDLYSDRVIPFFALPSARIPENLWAVSHCWVAASDRHDVWTSINGFQWPVPIPRRTTLDRIRIELLNLGAEYVFLDILCLRQYSTEDDERLRVYEWRLDVPTLGHIYRHEHHQTVIVYFNGLGRPFDIRLPVLKSQLHWFSRAWTLQETMVNWLPGGLRASIPGQAEGLYFTSYMRQAQHALGIPTCSPPCFATLLQAMHARPGYADKKPYDRVAALAYLLPSSRPAIYSKRWASPEEAWTALVEGLTRNERLALLAYEFPGTTSVVAKMTHALRVHWRPTWDEVMAYPRLPAEPHDCPYTEEEGLEGPVTHEWQRFYYHFVYVVEGCRTAGIGFVTLLSDGDDEFSVVSDSVLGTEVEGHRPRRSEKFRLESAIDLSDAIPFTLVGFGGLEWWVAGVREGTVDLGDGRIALRLHKFAGASNGLHMLTPSSSVCGKDVCYYSDICNLRRRFFVFRNAVGRLDYQGECYFESWSDIRDLCT